MSDSVRAHRRQPTWLLHPWDSPGKNTGVGCHFHLQCMHACSVASVVFDSVWPHGQQPTRLLVRGILQARALEWVVVIFSTPNRLRHCYLDVCYLQLNTFPTEANISTAYWSVIFRMDALTRNRKFKYVQNYRCCEWVRTGEEGAWRPGERASHLTWPCCSGEQ